MSYPYGSWPSPISSQHLVEDTLRFGSITTDHTFFYYTEGRPSEKGRSVLMQGSLLGEIKELLPPEYSVRTKAHEYGGKCIVAHGKTVYFIRDTDQSLYTINPEGVIKKLIHKPTMRFADFSLDPDCNFLYAIAEDHQGEQIENTLVRISLDDGHLENLFSGYDFYAAPRVSPDGTTLAWFCWNHPNMPWDGTELWTCSLVPGKKVDHAKKITGGIDESITTPLWSSNNILHFVSDRSGYWNLYRSVHGSIEPLCTCPIEFGAPHWVFGVERYCILEDQSVIAIGTTHGKDALYHIDPIQHSCSRIDTPFTALSDLYLLKNTLIFNGASPSLAHSIVALDLFTYKTRILKKSQNNRLDPAYISLPQEIAFPTEGGKTAYGFYYPPTHKTCKPLPNTKPPLIMRCHGGPTAHVPPKLNLEILYFTSRGFAFFEINYGGSSGYGREYRNRLRGNWGIVDVEDCCYAAKALCIKGLAHDDQLIIKGGSAGGFTTLATLLAGSTFKAGVSYFGVSDLEMLCQHTHKMELHYLDRLIGPYPENLDTYIERSPIRHVDRCSQPVIFFQGTEDCVVPPAQSEKMYQALVKKQIPTAYLLFEHEGHGFRRGDTIKKCIEVELLFYSKIFYFPLPEKLPSPHDIIDGSFSSSWINF
jgi:dipeptidyl aminopeptidase/acylaminoacyl peptidase